MEGACFTPRGPAPDSVLTQMPPTSDQIAALGRALPLRTMCVSGPHRHPLSDPQSLPAPHHALVL